MTSKIRLIVADLDGTLIDLRELHYSTLNRALASIAPEFIISPEDHTARFDGLTTKNKLSILIKERAFPANKQAEINALKQQYTLEALADFNNINFNIKPIIQKLKNEGYLFYVASNAVRATVEAGLKKLDILNLADKIFTNQDVQRPKPHPEIYLKCMLEAGSGPSETLVIEDSANGRLSGLHSHAYVCGLDNSFDFTYDRIKQAIKDSEAQSKPYRWPGRTDLNIVLPCAGLGSRFIKAGYQLPKPLIDVAGQPMIQKVVENLNIDANYIFIVQKSHYDQYNLGLLLPLIVPGCKIITVNGITDGAACTALLAKEFINNDKHLLIANSDQWVEWDSFDFMYSMLSSNVDGGILTFKGPENNKWSYAKIDEKTGYVVEVAEKKVISQHPTVGIYFFNKGKEFIKYAEQMIEKNIRVNGEFYLCPVYNEFIQDGKKIKIKDCQEMFGLGVPEDLQYFLTKFNLNK